MEAGGLSRPGGAGSVVDAAGGGLDAPWFEPLRPWASRSDPRPAGRIDLALLNRFAGERGLRTEDGLPVRFVDAAAAPPGAYERVIRDRGEVPTRVAGAGMLHDWFNALAWLAFPRTKARLNRLHCDALAQSAQRQACRGALRDAATLLDENGALFACRDPSLAASLRDRDWRALFVDGRERFARHATVRVLGHGLSEKLLAPYKAVCAHAWIVELPPHACAGPDGDDALDATLAQGLRSDALRAANLCPLPLLGVPGWWPANADPAFYDDTAVFRAGRGSRRKGSR
ncbi:MAG TPA: DUF3025 domain-containing protein [Zeimonas sp.]|nr:DUF3025 domain-containing protein [Zeimonas sp.]